MDDRSSALRRRGHQPRVHFGGAWVKSSVLEVFRDDVARFRNHAGQRRRVSYSLRQLAQGTLPDLAALRVHNGTIYRWNRPCYGIANGVAHLRIENRSLPAGPTVVDEIANAAFFWGCSMRSPTSSRESTASWPFDDAKDNLLAAARDGLDAQFTWLEGRPVPAAELILTELLPRAQQGLAAAVGIDAADAERFLGVIAKRVESKQTGARWMLDSLAAMPTRGSPDLRLRKPQPRPWSRRSALGVRYTNGNWHQLQAESDEGRNSVRTVAGLMSTDLLTVRPGDLIDLVAAVMDWARVRHNAGGRPTIGRLIGLVSYWSLLRMVACGEAADPSEPVRVETVMGRDPITVDADHDHKLDAIEIMREHRVGCLLRRRGRAARRDHHRARPGPRGADDCSSVTCATNDLVAHSFARPSPV